MIVALVFHIKCILFEMNREYETFSLVSLSLGRIKLKYQIETISQK